MKERRTARKPTSLAGQLLLAHPVLRDPSFRRTVVLLSSHNDEGAMGVVLNRPMGKQMGELNAEFALGPLAGVPLYYGGPVEQEQLIIVTWHWIPAEQAFQLHFGVEVEKAIEMIGLPGVTMRAFLGYSGWSKGQLEEELKHDAWVVTPVEGDWLIKHDGIPLWRGLITHLEPELKVLVDAPDDPTVN
ncbi:MAG TPA: YqgE/AlgH family protein [Lacunisphaera sp.]